MMKERIKKRARNRIRNQEYEREEKPEMRSRALQYTILVLLIKPDFEFLYERVDKSIRLSMHGNMKTCRKRKEEKNIIS